MAGCPVGVGGDQRGLSGWAIVGAVSAGEGEGEEGEEGEKEGGRGKRHC